MSDDDLSSLPDQMAAARRPEVSAPPAQERPAAKVHSTVMKPDGSGFANILVLDDPQPPWMTPELEQQNQELLDLVGQVDRRTQDVLRYGGHIPLESKFALQLRVLADMLFPRTSERGQRQYLEYQARVQKKLLEILNSVEDQIHQAQLGAGGSVSPEAMRRMAAQYGMPAPAAEQNRGG